NFVIKQGEWIDFATSRNKALELTEQYFPNATFMLMLDAEWILHNGKELLKYCNEQKNNSAQIYCIKLFGSNIHFYHSRLIRCKSNVKFVGKIHEEPNIAPQVKVPNIIYFEFTPTDYGQEKTETRWLKDRYILLEELQKDPTNSRNLFFLGQTNFALGDFSHAIECFKLRSTMSGYDEENFLTVYFLAQSYQALKDFEQMIDNYLKSFSMRPYRAEPLIKLAEYYYKINSYHLCYLFARHAATIAYPANDVSLIDSDLYNFTRYALLSATAYIVGDFNLGKQATFKALQAHPEIDYLYKNLQYYQEFLP
ncbi:hypothetical protein KBB68_02860, partial [Candidatus Babeliales bacterium]|nr:hypothetical protein [Candidatus Babeliales bacterium]